LQPLIRLNCLSCLGLGWKCKCHRLSCSWKFSRGSYLGPDK